MFLIRHPLNTIFFLSCLFKCTKILCTFVLPNILYNFLTFTSGIFYPSIALLQLHPSGLQWGSFRFPAVYERKAGYILARSPVCQRKVIFFQGILTFSYCFLFDYFIDLFCKQWTSSPSIDLSAHRLFNPAYPDSNFPLCHVSTWTCPDLNHLLLLWLYVYGQKDFFQPFCIC